MAYRPRHARRRPERGQIFKTTIVLQDILNAFVRWIATAKGISVTLPESTYVPLDGEGQRPVIILDNTPRGLLALPLATFHGTPPTGWNLFLQEVVVPIGLTIPETFDDRRSFDTEPTWTHPLNYATYVVPMLVTIPHDAKLSRYPVHMNLSDLTELEIHCGGIRNQLRSSPIDHVLKLVKSYKEQPTDKYRSQSEAPTEPSSAGVNTALAGSVAPRSAVLSFPRGAGSHASGCSVWSGGVSHSPAALPAASIMEVLHGNPPVPGHSQRL